MDKQMMVVFRERPEFTYEHVVEVDGSNYKIENGLLYLRGPSSRVPIFEKPPADSGSSAPRLVGFESVDVWEIAGEGGWANPADCWVEDISGRSPAVYKH